jgi:hypothetical protein
MLANSGRYEVCIWVYDHCPTADERAEWLCRHTIENAALASPPPDVWILREGSRLGDPHEAIRCPTVRAWRTSTRHNVSTTVRSTLEVQIPGEEPARIDLCDLLTEGVALDPDDWCCRFYRDPPTPEALRQAGEERLRSVEQARSEAEREAEAERRREAEARARAYAEESRRRYNATLLNGAGESALRTFGLTLPCTSDDVNRAYRKMVKEKKIHPDQGGNGEAMRALNELKDQAIAYLDLIASTKSEARCA